MEILILGTGRSSPYLIQYLAQTCLHENWDLTVADLDTRGAREFTKTNPGVKFENADISNPEILNTLVKAHRIVVSLLPPTLHHKVALACLENKKHLATASYVSAEMEKLDAEVSKNGLLFLNELGLDPGIDHLSAQEIIDNIHRDGGKIEAFYSYCGGLVAPESADNPWGYKFSWNPRNVILAGQGTARYKENGKLKFIPYSRLFEQHRKIKIPGLGNFDGYANRDSLTYVNHYGIPEIKTILRGTLRSEGFCKAWDLLVKIGLTDPSYQVPDKKNFSFPELIDALIPDGKGSLQERTARYLRTRADSPEMKKLKWLGLFQKQSFSTSGNSPADLLQKLLEEKWKLKKSDKDRVVLCHRFVYSVGTKKSEMLSSMDVIGKNSRETAMAKTVGLPLAMGVKLMAQNKIGLKGVRIPNYPVLYEPILKELKEHGIRFSESIKNLNKTRG
jgi:saccharopine dehydrogenase-like NADP-dependent oxidoreductase